MAFEIFGFKIERKSQDLANANVPAFTLPESDDGSMMVSGAGALGYSLDMDGQYKNEVELILKYRDMSQMADCEIAIDNIVNDAIVVDDILPSVSVVLDKTDLQKVLRKKFVQNSILYWIFSTLTIMVMIFFADGTLKEDCIITL